MNAEPSPARRKPLPNCPACGSDQVLPILCGYPGQELSEQAEAGKVAQGGCVITGNDPEWQSAQCGERWGREGHSQHSKASKVS